jgi:hypothetical protein
MQESASLVGQIISHYPHCRKTWRRYKAGDTNLHRFVALKLLPDEVAGKKSDALPELLTSFLGRPVLTVSTVDRLKQGD